MRQARLDEGVWVAPQIRLSDVAEMAAAGVGVVVNNRPDGEDASQPTSAQTEAEVRAAGMDYLHLPITGMPDAETVGRLAETLDTGRPVLLYCRSGTRSTVAWAMAMRALGRAEPDALRAAAAEAGYDLSRLPL